MVPGDKYEWSRVIFAKKSKFHDAGGPDTVVSPFDGLLCCVVPWWQPLKDVLCVDINKN